MAVFDIDETVLVARKWGDAVGANGEIPGALDFVKNLEKEGYSIAYCTARPEENRQEVMAALADYGFPHTPDLVFLIPRDGDNVPRYKKNTIASLMEQGYDVERFYDDQKINRSVVSNLGVPIVADLRDELPRQNPGTLGYINDNSYEPLVRNMARVRRKTVVVDPSVPIIDMNKLEAIGRQADFRWEICAASISGTVGENNRADLEISVTYSRELDFESGYMVHNPNSDNLKERPIYFSSGSKKTDKYGVQESVYWPFSLNSNHYFYAASNADKFPIGRYRGNTYLPVYWGYDNNRLAHEYYRKLRYAKPAGVAVAIYESPNLGCRCAVQYGCQGITWVIGKNKKLGKNQVLRELELIYSIGLVSDWIYGALIQAANNAGRSKRSALAVAFSQEEMKKLWNYSGASAETKESYMYFNELAWRSNEAIGQVRPQEDVEQVYEGLSLLCKAIALGTGSGLTRRQIYAGDKNDIQAAILRYLTQEPVDYDSARGIDERDRGMMKSIQYEAKLKRLQAEAPSLAEDLEDLIAARDEIYTDTTAADRAHLQVSRDEQEIYDKEYRADYAAAKAIFDAEERRAQQLLQAKNALSSQKRKELTYQDELKIRAAAAANVQAEIDAFVAEREAARAAREAEKAAAEAEKAAEEEV